MSQHDAIDDNANELVDQAVAQGGAYEIIRKRLIEQGNQLSTLTRALNEGRLEEFGSSEMEVVSRVRVRTDNNCVARDIVQVGSYLLFGYNVFIGLKKETAIEDVFALFEAQETEQGVELSPVSMDNTFLSDPGFTKDFDELYRYYKNTRLLQLRIKDGKLLAGFQIGDQLTDVRVFRWSVSPTGEVQYIDNRGERDLELPSPYDFEWTFVTRDDTVQGRHAHANVLDTVFVETTGGDLTVKVENNTEDGLGIYSEPVEDATQSLDDAQIAYAKVGALILLKIRPYREEQWRYLVFNTLTEQVVRIDAIGESCVQLPEDHGIIFPGGYYLPSGEFKTFDDAVPGLKFKRMIRSPNGEDVLYVFYQPEEGAVGLFAYNMIEKQLQNPIYGHGYALAENGRLVIFSAEEEPTRVHPMQVWQTPYVSDEFAAKAEPSQTFFGRIGNAELVRGISDLYSICRLIDNQAVSLRQYEELTKSAAKVFDAHYWIEESETQDIAECLRDISATSELVIDEFEKVQSIRAQSAKAMAEAESDQESLLIEARPDNWELAEQYVNALGKLRKQRGHLVSIKSLRYIDVARIEVMEKALEEREETLTEATVAFLADEKALLPYYDKIDELNAEIDAAETKATLAPLIEAVETTSEGLDLLSEIIGAMKVDDATVRTRIIDSVSEVYARLNQTKAAATRKRKNLGSSEAVAQFAAQFKLFSQSIASALGSANTPEKCDEQLSRLLIQLEEFESQFSDHDQFLADIMEKREEVYESFESHKQQLLDERQRKAQTLADAAGRILSSIEKRSLKFTEKDELNTYFASDALVLKVRDLVEELRELDSAVKADDIESRYKAITEQALRSLRDKTDIYESGGNVIKLGPRHRFSVNTQELDLTIIPREGELNTHLTGTDFFEPIESSELLELKAYWDMSLESETPEVYRSEFLAYAIYDAAENNASDLSLPVLYDALSKETLADIVKGFAAPRYKEGYQKGIHDHDAVLILQTLLPALKNVELLKYDAKTRAIAQLFWLDTTRSIEAQKRQKTPEQVDRDLLASIVTWPARARAALQLNAEFKSRRAMDLLAAEIEQSLSCFVAEAKFEVSGERVRAAAYYLVDEYSRDELSFINSQYGQDLFDSLKRSLNDIAWGALEKSIQELSGKPGEQWHLAQAWLEAYIESQDSDEATVLTGSRYLPEAATMLISADLIPRRPSPTKLEFSVEGLLGEHPRVKEQTLQLGVDDFLTRMKDHLERVLPAYRRYLHVRQEVITKERDALRLNEFKARPLSSFVRNRLINESYLPLIGDNLAKQMGTVGDGKRSDLMGLLMMISPPGYGKTTLMEYVANRLGLIFMKINCPSLGHDVMSLDPEQAPNATARQELLKLNLGLEMGNNVMLYLDDIQHTHPEFLQKFISLCDGTRRIEGVWKGRTKTYDMRGKKFCVVMAGNPYTESGEAFKVPDMLANRADIYNLGDILGGTEEQFALSYIENALTSNPVLAPLAVREMQDVYRLIDMAKGKDVPTTDLSHSYSGAEINEIVSVLQKMFVIQDVVLKINQQYIASAAQNDQYRTEPPFKLQGSYRNMNKMSEKVSAVMNESELLQMIEDHYLGESQLLTSGAEDNLLKLAELRGNMTPEQKTRWEEIKKDFLRNKAMGGDADVGGKVVAQLVDLVDGVKSLGKLADNQKTVETSHNQSPITEKVMAEVTSCVEKLSSLKPEINIVNQPIPGLEKILRTLADTIEHALMPVVRSMDKKIDIDLKTQRKMVEISEQLRSLRGFIDADSALAAKGDSEQGLDA